tara:strand:- start:278 stop:496 length:219 start_codon:yes stop_codon:yes gene_type:complete
VFLLSSAVLKSDRNQVVRLVRDDGVEDALTRRCYVTYDEAYDELERFYGDLCCSDDRVEYSIIQAEFEGEDS